MRRVHLLRAVASTTATLAVLSAVATGCPGDETSSDTNTGDISTDTTTDGTGSDTFTCPDDWFCGPAADVVTPPDAGTDGPVGPALVPWSGQSYGDGALGDGCTADADCLSGFCIAAPDGASRICTQTCFESCPDGYGCKVLPLPDPISVCAPNVLDYCGPCQGDEGCFDGVCFDNGVNDPFCTGACSDEQPCLAGFECQDNVCVPTSGSCGCSAQSVGAVRPCVITNVQGSCQGFETCNGENWVDCDAPTPVAELCDYQDNDCDGSIDEDFVNSEGIYDTNGHCGVCGSSCDGAIINATASCNAGDYDPALCVVETCDTGYFQLNDFYCGTIPAKLCSVCETDANCVIPGARCSTLTDGGTYCTTPCATSADCPSGYGCQDLLSDGNLQCVPSTGSCLCDDSSIGLQRACEQTYLDPGKPEVTCVGTEECQDTGWTDCSLPEDICDNADNDCDGIVDNAFVNEDGVYYTDENCGVCGNNCLQDAPPGAVPACDISGPVPVCGIACDPGKVDVNKNPSDGCECTIDDVPDVPDGVDHDCDGVDGAASNAIFVAKNGNDSNDGTLAAPLLTIQAGIAKAVADSKLYVFVATGVYPESVTLSAGVRAFGGYSGDFLDRDITLYQTAVFGQAPTAEAPGAVNAIGLGSQATVFSGFTVFGFVNKQSGGSSYGIYVQDTGDQLSLLDNIISAGSGGNGNAGVAGTGGDSGVAGSGGQEATDLSGESCAAANHRAGGDGGTFTCGGQDVSGGIGGSAICPDYSEADAAGACPVTGTQTSTAEETGGAGNGDTPGAGGAAGFDSYKIPKLDGACGDPDSPGACGVCSGPQDGLGTKAGSVGDAGAAGTAGTSGTGCDAAAGAVVNGLWVAGDGEVGGDGANGSGGGGGGAGGGVEQTGCLQYVVFGGLDLGGSGGGGGSGGCGGTAGTGGTGGGGSFGIFLTWTAPDPTSTPTISGNVITRSTGGDGGAGGPGGGGGAGASGGAGGPESSGDVALVGCAPAGGDGGDGGNGGAGGGGGGACGGASFGIFVHNATGAAEWQSGNTFANDGGSGAGGSGGSSLGNNGGDGLAGAEGNTNY